MFFKILHRVIFFIIKLKFSIFQFDFLRRGVIECIITLLLKIEQSIPTLFPVCYQSSRGSVNKTRNYYGIQICI